MLNLPPLEIVKEAGWLTIWLNRPETRNALSSEMIEALMAAFQDIATDQNIRGVTLRGKGNTFCAGGDLKGFKSMAAGDQSFEEITAMSRNAGELFMAVSRLPQIVVVLIEGAAMAGGLGLACAADIVASTRSAKFSLTETMIGIPPAQIAPYIVRRVGPTLAKRIMLTGMRMQGDQAMEFGLLDHVCDDAEGLPVFENAIRQGVMRCAPGANAATKEILRVTELLPPEKFVEFAAKQFAEALQGEEGREGVASFLEKRKPAWALT